MRGWIRGLREAPESFVSAYGCACIGRLLLAIRLLPHRQGIEKSVVVWVWSVVAPPRWLRG
jgi:hypothetical protein